MSFGVRLLLGALAVGGGVDSTHHRSASFWSDLDDGSSVPKGAEGSSPSALPRLSREVVVPIIAVSLNTDSAPSPGGSIIILPQTAEVFDLRRVWHFAKRFFLSLSRRGTVVELTRVCREGFWP